MNTECEVCGREKGDPKASYVWRNAEEMNRLCHRRAGDTWGRAADCYSRGYTRLRSALADAEKARDEALDRAAWQGEQVHEHERRAEKAEAENASLRERVAMAGAFMDACEKNLDGDTREKIAREAIALSSGATSVGVEPK